MRATRAKSAVEVRRNHIIRQLEELRARLIKKNPAHYADEHTYRAQVKRTHELISEFEGELSTLDCPGEYDELPVAVVADELGLSYGKVRGLIKLGEIAAVGRAAHERINRAELERITTIGVSKLLRLGRQEAAEIFEQSISCLQCDNLQAAGRAYRRLEARQSWRGPYAPAYLVGLEIAQGDLESALTSIKLIYDGEDVHKRVMTFNCLGRVLRSIRPIGRTAHELCEQLIVLADSGIISNEQLNRKEPKQLRSKARDNLQQRAVYLTTSILEALRRCWYVNSHTRDVPARSMEAESELSIRNAVYTALYAEYFYERSTACRIYVDAVMSRSPRDSLQAELLINLLETAQLGDEP